VPVQLKGVLKVNAPTDVMPTARSSMNSVSGNTDTPNNRPSVPNWVRAPLGPNRTAAAPPSGSKSCAWMNNSVRVSTPPLGTSRTEPPTTWEPPPPAPYHSPVHSLPSVSIRFAWHSERLALLNTVSVSTTPDAA